MIHAMSYGSFGIKVGNLSELEWKNITKQTEVGDTWIVQEKGGAGCAFRVSLSRRERYSTPGGTVPIQRDDFPTGAEIKDAIRRAIERALVSPGLEDIKPRREFPITVTCFDLYNAAGVIC